MKTLRIMKAVQETGPPGAKAHTLVFSIPELLETILLHLPHRTLLLSTRVSKGWQRAITSSPLIQERLFFVATKDPNHEAEHNPLLTALFPPVFEPRRPTDCHYRDGEFCSNHFRELPWFDDRRKKASVMNPRASWRRMFPVQPPAKIESIRDQSGCGCHFDNEVGTIPENLQDDGGGVRMGVLYDVLIEQMDEGASGGGFIVEWLMFKKVALPYWVREDMERSAKEHLEAYGVPDERLSEVWPDEETDVSHAIRVSIAWERDCYGEKSDDLCGLEIRKEKKPLVTWVHDDR